MSYSQYTKSQSVSNPGGLDHDEEEEEEEEEEETQPLDNQSYVLGKHADKFASADTSDDNSQEREHRAKNHK